MAGHDQATFQLLPEFGITLPEWTLLNLVHYGIHTTPDDLPHCCTTLDYSLGRETTLGERQAALDACLTKGWLQEVDTKVLRQLAEEIRDGQFLGPIYGWPQPGQVDFAPAGARLWQRFAERAFFNPQHPPFAFIDVVHLKEARYFPTREAAMVDMEGASQEEGTSVTGPTAIGTWRAQWWRRFSEGYRIDIETRCHWEGRGGGGGEGCFVDYSTHGRSDPTLLQHVLARHNVTLAEWLLLAAIDGGPITDRSWLPRWVSEAAERDCGVAVSEADCRTGLEACVRYGWLRVVDAGHVSEVTALMRDDRARSLLSRPIKRPGELDFSPVGATFYRMIAAEFAGPGWEDDFKVARGYYREEHRYCVSEAGIHAALDHYALFGEVVRASRLIPIGPWCVYWWERFPAGFRLEVEIGDPSGPEGPS